jgi:hypothetical protein
MGKGAAEYSFYMKIVGGFESKLIRFGDDSTLIQQD